MKTLTLLICLFCAPLFAALPPGVVGKKIFEYPNQPVPLGSYLFLIDSGNGTYFNISLTQLQAMSTNAGIIIVTNASFQYLTNLYAYITNLYSTNITVQNLITTNITVNVPGGVTNLNLTPNSLMQSDSGDAEASVPNGTGILTNNGAGSFGWVAVAGLGGNYVLANNGNGTNTTNWGVSHFQEIDAVDFFPTNTFLPLTNVLLSTDGNGQITNVGIGSGLSLSGNVLSETGTNTSVFYSTNFSTNLYSTTAYITNLFFVSGKGNTLIVTNVSIENTLTNKGVAASSAVITDASQVETNAINAHGVFTNSSTGPPSFGLLQNTELKNSTVTFSGTVNQITGGGSTALGASATAFAIASPLIAPGVVSATGLTNTGFSAIGAVTNDANGKLYTTPLLDPALLNLTRATNNDGAVTNEVTRQINSGTNIYSSLGTAISDISTATNLSYAYKFLSNVGNGVVTFGQGIFTNISADRTLASLTYGLLGANGYETAIVAVTNSDTAVHTLTMPANVIGKPGKVAPGVFYITNGVISQIMISHMGALYTNACYDF